MHYIEGRTHHTHKYIVYRKIGSNSLFVCDRRCVVEGVHVGVWSKVCMYTCRCVVEGTQVGMDEGNIITISNLLVTLHMYDAAA